jgi:hypothetical protein
LKQFVNRAKVFDPAPRIVFTDEEALAELCRYESEIYSVTIESRFYFWLTQFSLLIVSLVSVYVSAFLVTPSSLTNTQTLIPQSEDQNKVLFIFFMSGFYQNGQSL